MRLGRNSFGMEKGVIEEVWFGNCKSAEELKDNRLNSILSMKIGHSRYLRKQLI